MCWGLFCFVFSSFLGQPEQMGCFKALKKYLKVFEFSNNLMGILIFRSLYSDYVYPHHFPPLFFIFFFFLIIKVTLTYNQNLKNTHQKVPKITLNPLKVWLCLERTSPQQHIYQQNSIWESLFAQPCSYWVLFIFVIFANMMGENCLCILFCLSY